MRESYPKDKPSAKEMKEKREKAKEEKEKAKRAMEKKIRSMARPGFKLDNCVTSAITAVSAAAIAWADFNDRMLLSWTIRDIRNFLTWRMLDQKDTRHNEMDVMLIGMKAALFAAGEERDLYVKKPTHMKVQGFEVIRKFMADHYIEINQTAATLNLLRHASQGLVKKVAFIMNACCETTFLANDWARYIDTNRAMEELAKDTNKLLKLKSEPAKMIPNPKVLNAMQATGMGVSTVTTFIAIFCGDYSTVRIPLIAMLTGIIGITLGFAGSIGAKIMRTHQLTQITRAIDTAKNDADKIRDQRSRNLDIFLIFKAAEYGFTAFLGIGAALMVVVTFLIDNTNFKKREEYQNREAAIKTACNSVEIGAQIGLEITAVKNLMKRENIVIPAQDNDLNRSQYLNKLKECLVERRLQNMNDDLVKDGKLDIQKSVNDDIDAEKGQIKIPNTTTPFQDIQRIMIQMAEEGRLKEGIETAQFIDSVRTAQISEVTGEPYEQLQNLSLQFQHAETPEFLMQYLQDPLQYHEATKDQKKEIEHGNPDFDKDPIDQSYLKKAVQAILQNYSAPFEKQIPHEYICENYGLNNRLITHDTLELLVP